MLKSVNEFEKSDKNTVKSAIAYENKLDAMTKQLAEAQQI